MIAPARLLAIRQIELVMTTNLELSRDVTDKGLGQLTSVQ